MLAHLVFWLESYVTQVKAILAEETPELLHGAPSGDDKNSALARLGTLALKSDTYDAVEDEDKDPEYLDVRADIFLAIWPEAAEMRRSGKLLALAKQIVCPVIAIHGDYDAHSADGVREPLSKALTDFRLVLLKQCGHKPWIEKHAKHEFYDILLKSLTYSLV